MTLLKTPGFRAALLGSVVLLATVLPGCDSGQTENTKLKVGTVDIVRVMEQRPETTSIRLDWTAQAGDTYMEISGVSDSAEALALKKEIAKRSEAWQKRMDEFMEESIKLVETETAEIAKERGLDIVIVDNPMTKSIQYREAEDLTLDVSFKLQSRE